MRVKTQTWISYIRKRKQRSHFIGILIAKQHIHAAYFAEEIVDKHLTDQSQVYAWVKMY